MAIFNRSQRIFDNAEPLDESYEPDEIKSREEELNKYQRALQPIIDNRPTSNVFLYGKTGTGKTLTTRYMLSHLKESAREYDDVNLSIVSVSCQNVSSSYQLATKLANELLSDRGADPISVTGHSQEHVFNILYDELDRLGGTILTVLDEVDNIGHSDDILYGLPRARSNGNLEDANPVVIGISNDFQFHDNLSPKVKDTLAEKEILFPPYSADQLRPILEPRAEEAFYDDVLDDAVVPMCAAIAAKDTGSARQAIRLLREAGELAQAQADEMVTEEHVEKAQNEMEKDQLYQGMQDLTTQGHTVLATLSHFEARGDTPVRTQDLYSQYRNICESLDIDKIGKRRVRDHLSDMEMLGLTTVYHRNKGRSGGQYYEYDLDVGLDSVLDVLGSTSRFKSVAQAIQATNEGQ